MTVAIAVYALLASFFNGLYFIIAAHYTSHVRLATDVDSGTCCYWVLKVGLPRKSSAIARATVRTVIVFCARAPLAQVTRRSLQV